jgi:anti-sigma regulatory factor (Ser/Thr protein kinase)
VEVSLSQSFRVAVQESSQVGEARRIGRGLAQDCGFDEIRTEEVAIVVTELCTNLVKHGDGGEIILRISGDPHEDLPELELLALDRGPGIGNLEQCLRDGFSTGSSPGQGLGAVTRLSAVSDFYSSGGRGTAVLARWPTRPSGGRDRSDDLRFGAVNINKPGQEVCGDSWGSVQIESDVTVMVADGLGHGPEAQTASLEAVRILHLNPRLLPGELLERTHQALRSSRGAAVAVARIDTAKQSVIFAGVGNISGQIYAGAEGRQHMVSVNGTAGHQTQRIREFSYAWPANGMLVMHSDGLSTQTGLETHAGLALRDPTLIAGVLYRDFSRGNDDATVVVAKSA